MGQEQEFSGLWAEARNAVFYRCKIEEIAGRLLTERSISDIYRQEVIEKRFFSRKLCHPAGIWLQRLQKDFPLEGEKAAHVLQCSPEAGVHLTSIVAKAGGGAAAGGILGAVLHRNKPLAAITGIVVSAAGMGLAAVDAHGGSRRAFKQLEREMDARAAAVIRIISKLPAGGQENTADGSEEGEPDGQ